MSDEAPGSSQQELLEGGGLVVELHQPLQGAPRVGRQRPLQLRGTLLGHVLAPRHRDVAQAGRHVGGQHLQPRVRQLGAHAHVHHLQRLQPRQGRHGGLVGQVLAQAEVQPAECPQRGQRRQRLAPQPLALAQRQRLQPRQRRRQLRQHRVRHGGAAVQGQRTQAPARGACQHGDGVVGHRRAAGHLQVLQPGKHGGAHAGDARALAQGQAPQQGQSRPRRCDAAVRQLPLVRQHHPLQPPQRPQRLQTAVRQPPGLVQLQAGEAAQSSQSSNTRVCRRVRLVNAELLEGSQAGDGSQGGVGDGPGMLLGAAARQGQAYQAGQARKQGAPPRVGPRRVLLVPQPRLQARQRRQCCGRRQACIADEEAVGDFEVPEAGCARRQAAHRRICHLAAGGEVESREVGQPRTRRHTSVRQAVQRLQVQALQLRQCRHHNLHTRIRHLEAASQGEMGETGEGCQTSQAAVCHCAATLQ
mmetsp:Transcript_19470/g.58849  ORF Transcript_19470/g.58849 Transcript_19470/m.58849 type:complete len:472 (+) Transcript_19470:3208-4623(+)